MSSPQHNIKPELAGIPETMLWTLYNRASDCLLDNHILVDPKCVEIFQSMDYDFLKTFNKPDYGHAFRSFAFDREIKAFLDKNPNGMIINLGEGLETQRFRLDNYPQSLWVSIDVPEAIAIREKFIQPDEQHLHIGKSALDFSWADDLPTDRPVFFTAQGLLMYFPEEEVRSLLRFLAKLYPDSYFMFDTLHKVMSKKSMSKNGWYKTPRYRCPPMPWGVDVKEVRPFIEDALGKKVDYHFIHYKMPHGSYKFFNFLCLIPGINNFMPIIATVHFPKA